MPVNERWNVDIPDGYRIYEREFPIAGIQHHRKDFIGIMRKGNMTFGMEKDPANRFDPNAVRVVAARKTLFGNKKRTIGYIPAEIASQIADSKLFSKLMMRPKAFYIGDNGYVDFKVDLLGPKEDHDAYANV